LLVDSEYQKYLKQLEEIEQERNSSNVVTIHCDDLNRESFEYYGDPHAILYLGSKNPFFPWGGDVNEVM
jgi:hypothetical protein